MNEWIPLKNRILSFPPSSPLLSCLFLPSSVFPSSLPPSLPSIFLSRDGFFRKNNFLHEETDLFHKNVTIADSLPQFDFPGITCFLLIKCEWCGRGQSRKVTQVTGEMGVAKPGFTCTLPSSTFSLPFLSQATLSSHPREIPLHSISSNLPFSMQVSWQFSCPSLISNFIDYFISITHINSNSSLQEEKTHINILVFKTPLLLDSVYATCSTLIIQF